MFLMNSLILKIIAYQNAMHIEWFIVLLSLYTYKIMKYIIFNLKIRWYILPKSE